MRSSGGLKQSLPQFVEPMLASTGKPFNSDEYLFEIKWDGTRALAFVDRDLRMVNRRRVQIDWRYPELRDLGRLPAGSIVDGEIVVIHEGKPNFNLLQAREQTRLREQVAHKARRTPATYIAFDLLYDRYRPILHEPLEKRRERLRELVAELDSPRVVMSEGVEGAGVAFFRDAEQRGLEGVMAKLLRSRYAPGKRSDAWIKIKRQLFVACVVIGFVPKGDDDFESLLLAAQDGPDLPPRYVGRVGSGFSDIERATVNEFLRCHICTKSVVEAKHKDAVWVEARLYCTIRCMERTSTGQLRAPTVAQLHLPQNGVGRGK
jgi:ATP-dependent DNA ligase